MTDLAALSALEQAAAVRRREVSPVELTQAALERLAAVDPLVGAFTTVTAERALDEARAAERAVLERPDRLGPLHGVPTAHKDLTRTAGVRTTFGSAAYEDFVPDGDDAVVTLVRAAGLVSLGKTNTPEFGLPCYTEPDVAPPARTPWDLSRSAGGSSGGAGAAVGSGILALAPGSDGGGSIRIPASVNGVVGLKPTRGRVSAGPVNGELAGLGVAGPLARTVRDAAALLDVLAVPQPGDPWSAPAAPGRGGFLAACDRPPGRLRVGRWATPVIADVAVAPECLEAYEAATALLTALGHEVEDVQPPFDGSLVPHFELIWAAGAAMVPVPDGRGDRLRPLTRVLREFGAGITAVQYAQALFALQQVSRRAAVQLAGYDVLLSPTLAALPALVGGLRDDADPMADFAAQKAFTPFTAVYNTTGQPAVSLPLHWTTGGLPVGVMLAGRHGGEELLLSLAAQLEQARPWADRRPPVWAA